jgi:hypothetical protein
MDIRESLLREHSKANTKAVAQWIGRDPERFASLGGVFPERRVPPGATGRLGLE